MAADKKLSHEEVQQILSLIEQLDKSEFNFLTLEIGDLKLTLAKEGAPGNPPAKPAVAAAQPPAADPVTSPAAAAGKQEAAPAVDDGTVPITAPMVGRFYAQSEPGTPPFVSVGSRVDSDTTVGLIEVMKVFNAVQAGVAGLITAVCVENGSFVEHGQTLFRVQPVQEDASA